MQIAGKLTDKDWEELVICLDITKQENWGTAFNFFEQRITTRYLNPIKAILDMDLRTGEGFAVVNLQCSLIETIECFYRGWCHIEYKKYIDSDGAKISKSNVEIFKLFFLNREPFKIKEIDGSDFCNNVRNALLHETQTKCNWKIKSGNVEIYEKVEVNKIIYREAFQRGIETLISNYKNEIIQGNDDKLRKNFIAKFNHICTQS